MRWLIVFGVLVVGGGAWIAWQFGVGQPYGSVACLSQKKVCVGDPVAPRAILEIAPHLGQPLDVTCGIERPGYMGEGADARRMTVHRMALGECTASGYVASFSDGRRLRSVWVQNDRIVRLDDYPRHSFDP